MGVDGVDRNLESQRIALPGAGEDPETEIVPDGRGAEVELAAVGRGVASMRSIGPNATGLTSPVLDMRTRGSHAETRTRRRRQAVD